MAGGVVQVVECLLCKHEALSSNCGSTKKKKKDKLFTYAIGNLKLE
jgi:hypothetical protein